ncbi:TniQ family protein [Embleya sp. NPDC059267]|uniref:TniQ family protein n=1 Tax=unclassified Embleya TaxID=2699296 RepID=UPI0036B687D7
MAPLPHESTASWVGRVAGVYRQSVPELPAGIGIATIGTRGAGEMDTTEIHLEDAAWHRLAVLTRVPHHHLARALPHLARPRNRNPARTPDTVRATVGATGAGIAASHRPGPYEQPSWACPWCTLRHTRGATARARAYLPAHRVWCPRHACRSTDGPRPRLLDTRGVPELAHTHREHRRLGRGPNANNAYTWAQAIVTRWYDHELYPTGRWRARGHRLAVGNPDHTATHSSSWELTARPVIVHPETVTLARALARTRLPATPRPEHHPAVTALLSSNTPPTHSDSAPSRPDPTTSCGPGSATTPDPEKARPASRSPEPPETVRQTLPRLRHSQPNCTKSQRIPQHPRNPLQARKHQLRHTAEPHPNTPPHTPKTHPASPAPGTTIPTQQRNPNPHPPHHPTTNNHPQRPITIYGWSVSRHPAPQGSQGRSRRDRSHGTSRRATTAAVGTQGSGGRGEPLPAVLACRLRPVTRCPGSIATLPRSR